MSETQIWATDQRLAWGDGGLVWVVVSAIAWLLIGILTFGVGERIAKRTGGLSHA